MTSKGSSAAPKHLGRFEVGAKIGGGGMATVFVGRAVRTEGDELVALKVIRDELAHDEQFTAMFVDEAKILARLSHKNVIHTLEYGVSGHHRYIAMELLSGRTFADVWDTLAFEGQRLDRRLGAYICARVAEGLHSAHELVDEDGQPLNVIHRDVNPTNVFLTHAGEVKLIDFGLAKARVRSSKSADGIVKGKIPYLAPEQASGKAIDRRTDVYALGTTLWEATTMKRLFKRDTDVDTLRAIRDAHVPDPRATMDDFPTALWKIIDKALRRDANERYASAAEMQAALDAFVGDPKGLDKELARLVSRLFPGGEAKQAQWLRDAAAVRAPATMPPPAPVALASSSGLDVAKDAGPSSDRDVSGDLGASDASGEHARSDGSEPSIGGTKKKRKGATKAKQLRAETARRDEETAKGTRKLWLPVGIIVVILIVLAVVFSNR